jgi:pimeloyl-ACP methyl ester carboxylesterase
MLPPYFPKQISRRVMLVTLAAVGACASVPDFGASRRSVIDTPRGPLEVYDDGPAGGSPLVLLPSLGRGAEDFDELTSQLTAAGYRVIRPQPRGIGASRSYDFNPTLADLADDVILAAQQSNLAPFVVVGHAFGNRVARMIATQSPERTRALILLAAGGKIAMAPEIEEALVRSFDLSLPDDERLAYVSRAFFAPGNTPEAWRNGWYPDVAEMQIGATERTSVDDWWLANSLPVLVVQPMQDVLAPPENAEILKREGGDRVRIAYVEQAGHALLPEQPRILADTILSYLQEIDFQVA